MELSRDMITSLPQPIIETILCFLPIEEAARTSILAKEWRYKWTTIPKLEFSKSTVKRDWSQLSQSGHALRNKDIWCKLISAMKQVLLLRQGPIHEFTLSIDGYHIFKEVEGIILPLSKNYTVKKLTLEFYNSGLPLSFFSLNHLTDLCLGCRCQLIHTPLSNEFGSLTRLALSKVFTTKETLLYLLSNCPSLKCLDLLLHEQNFDGYEKPSMMELFKCLPMIENLTTWGPAILFLVQYSVVPKELPVSLVHLRYCSIKEVCLYDVRDLTFLLSLVKCAPNLEKVILEIDTSDDIEKRLVKWKEYYDILEEFSNIWLEHLNVLKIEYLREYVPDLEFVKVILARSPNLKKVILTTYLHDENEVLELSRNLKHAPHVSPVEIIVENIVKGICDGN